MIITIYNQVDIQKQQGGYLKDRKLALEQVLLGAVCKRNHQIVRN